MSEALKQQNYKLFLTEMTEQKVELSSKPLSIQVALTNMCNLSCSFCPGRGLNCDTTKPPYHMPFETINKLNPFFSSLKHFSPTSSNGEPFLYKSFPEFIDLADSTNLSSVMQLVSNGTQIHRHGFNILSRINNITISFDAAEKDLFELLRRGSKFEQVIENITKLRKEQPEITMQAHTVVNRLNLEKLVDIYEFVKDKGFNALSLNNIIGSKDNPAIQLLRLRLSDREFFLRQIDEINKLNDGENFSVIDCLDYTNYFEDGEPLDIGKITTQLKNLCSNNVVLNNAKKCSVQDLYRVKTENRSGKIESLRLPYCTQPFYHMNIQEDGVLWACCADTPLELGAHFDEKSPVEIWNSDIYTNLREAMWNCDMLPDCCIKCNSFVRYAYIDEYYENLCATNSLRGGLIVPKNFNPPVSMVKNPELQKIIQRTERINNFTQEEVNTLGWRNNYFSGGKREAFEGDKQTVFFARLALENIPIEIVNYVNEAQLSICDIRCAHGGALPLLARCFPHSKFYGIDFSEAAIKKAAERFPDFTFNHGSLDSMTESYDVIYCSNILEHFADPWNQLKLLMNKCNRYAIILVPFEGCSHETYRFTFDDNFFAQKSASFTLKHFSVVNETFGDMAVVVYEKEPTNKMVIENTSQANPSTWDKVAQEYSIIIDDGEYELANEIVAILKNNGIQPGSKVLELGCGSGHLSACLAMVGYNTALLDFSTESLEKAQKTYKEYGLAGEFIQGDIMNLDSLRENDYDLVWNSGVMEHFSDIDFSVAIENLAEIAYKSVFILVPNPLSISYLLMRYVRQSKNDWPYGMEYLRKDYDRALRAVGFDVVTHHLAKAATCHNFWVAMNDSAYWDAYADLLYRDLLPANENYLIGYFSTRSHECSESALHSSSADIKTHVFDLNAERFGLHKERDKLSFELKQAQQENTLTAEQLKQAQQENTLTTEQLKQAQQENTFTTEQFKQAQQENTLTTEQLKQAQQENTLATEQLKQAQQMLINLHEQINELTSHVEILGCERDNAFSIIANVRNTVSGLMRTRIFKLIHLWARFKHQLLSGNMGEKRNFFRWLKARSTNTPHRGKVYNPLTRIMEATETNLQVTSFVPNSSDLYQHLEKERSRFNRLLTGNMSGNARMVREIIDGWPNNKILVYPHVVHWEPFQTPQQLLRAFARNGWLCFFCEHPEIKNNFYEAEPGIHIVPEHVFLEAVGTTHVTVLMTWMASHAFVERIRSKAVWYHVLDQIDIFPCFDDYYVTLHDKYAEEASMVSYVADPLKKCLTTVKNAVYLPNGVNPCEFLVSDSDVPEVMVSIMRKGNKVIGYYGYLAEWMDYKTVRLVAELRPNFEFVFIGQAITDVSQISDLPNIHLLGLKPYEELHKYAKCFDVATIPFLMNDMMNCVSPIKFYEYCALGLPVISSSIAEVEKHRCDFIACYTNADEYLFYLDHYTNSAIKDKAKISGPVVAQSNSWDVRVDKALQTLNAPKNFILTQEYRKFDVVILSVIDFDFRHQRPQHLALKFAADGHRVFYFNANHFSDFSIHNKEDNLYVINIQNSRSQAIHVTDWNDDLGSLQAYFDKVFNQYAVRDAVVIVDYPNWIHGAEYLRNKFGFKIITDYMDDFTGFINPSEKLVKENCIDLLADSDHVIASSQFLYDIAIKHNERVSTVRNGTEHDFFFSVKGKNASNRKKIIGYYGAIAHWFACDIVCHVAKSLPEFDIVLIGEVTEFHAELQAHSNIKLLGEKPYKELPSYLWEFDVCLIPFDTSTDLIKATNPVKFYEYLSAGKKIVATEIPELEPFRNEYVLMSNNKEVFLSHVQSCLNGTDSLKGCDLLMKQGQLNDWHIRYEDFLQLIKGTVPKVSVVVLMYNNMKLNKLCISTIFEKTAYPNFEVIIVDNYSTDGTREWLAELDRENIPSLKIVLNDSNKGFAAGNNIGMKECNGDYIILLNNDTVVTRGWITALVKHLENSSEMGMSGSVTNSIGNEAKIAVDYSNLTEIHQFADRYTWEHMGNVYHKEPDVLAMFALCIKREIIDKCGYIDESYSIGMFEDDDYSKAVKNAGYKLCIAEDSFIHHFEGSSFKKMEDDEFMKLFNKNKEIFNTKWKTTHNGHERRLGVDGMTNMHIKIDYHKFCIGGK